MKKLLFLTMVILLLTSCSSKTITTSPMGGKTIETETDASAYSKAQAEAWKGYYEALKSPPVIATVTQPDGSVISINSQVPPPVPVIRQHENQIIKPIESMVNTGLKYVGGGYFIKEGIEALQGTHITNTGDGTVTIDRSESVSVETIHAEEGSALNQDSYNDSSDRSVIDSHDTTAPAPDPVIVRPDVVVVQPSYPPETTE